MLDENTINVEIDALKKEHSKKMDLLQQLRNSIAQTEAEIHHLSGAVAMCEKLLNMTSDKVDNARKIK